MKKIVIAGFMVLCGFVASGLAANVSWNAADGSWDVDANWGGGTQPGATDVAYINRWKATIDSDVGSVAALFAGYTALTGYLDIKDGGNLLVTTESGRIGRSGYAGASGVINMTGGTLQYGTSQEARLIIGLDSNDTLKEQGSMTISGGTLAAKILLGGNIVGGSEDLFRVEGGAATIGSTHVGAGYGLEVRYTGAMEFAFDGSGISEMIFADDASFHSNSKILVDGFRYAGAATEFTLIDAASFSGMPQIVLTNFYGGASYGWDTANGAFTVTASNSISRTVYVATNGNDSWSGRFPVPTDGDGPLATLIGARDRIREIRGESDRDGFEVLVRGGTYYESPTLRLYEQDSGMNGSPVVYKSYPGERAKICGSQQITNWIQDTSCGISNLWKASLSGTNNFRQLYVDGVKAERAKGEYTPFLLANQTEVFTRYIDGTNTTFVDIYDGYTPKYDDSIYSWRNIGDIEFSYSYWFVNHKVSVDSVAYDSQTNRYLKMKQPGFRDAQIKMLRNLPAGYFYIENSYELMDEPGEWYFDRGSNTCYYIAGAGEVLTSSNIITFPVVETLVTLSGTTNSVVQNIQFQNIDFDCTTWMQPSIGGYAEAQGGLMKDPNEDGILHSSYLKPDAAIEMEYAHNIVFEGNSFSRLGAVGVSMDSGCQSNVVVGNIFEECASSAVQIGGFTKEDAHPNVPADPSWGQKVVKDNLIANNYMNRIGTEFFGAAAVLVGFTDGAKVLHNHISDASWVGVSIGCSLGYWDEGGRSPTPINYPVYTEPTVSKNNQVSFNHIYNAFQHLGDGGAIYTQSSMTNSSIVGNYIHDNEHRYGGIYFDTGSAGVLVESNLVHHVVTPFISNWRSFVGQQKDAGPLTNYLDVEPSSAEFPLAVAEAAGLESAYGSLYTSPEIIAIDQGRYSAYLDIIEIRGINFGSSTGDVVFAGSSGAVTLSSVADGVLLWTKSRILCAIPNDAVSGAVYIRRDDDICSNDGALTYAIGDFEGISQAVTDDFDEYAPGVFSDSSYTMTDNGSGDFYIINTKKVSSPNSLKIISNGGEAQVSRYGAWSGEILLTFNLNIYTALTGTNSLIICPLYYDHVNYYGLSILPNGGNNLVLEKCVNNDVPEVMAEASKSFDSATWYTVKILLLEGAMSAKVWPYGSPEPLGWDIQTDHVSGLYTDKGMSQVSVNLDTTGSSGDRIVLVDDLYVADFVEDPVNVIDNVFEDNFSGYTVGVLPLDVYTVNSPFQTNCTVANEGGGLGNVLTVRANNSGNPKLYTSSSWREAVVRLDFRVNDLFGSAEGLYICPYYVNDSNMYQLFIQPSGSNSTIKLTRVLGGSASTDVVWEEDLQTNCWYTAKFLVSEKTGGVLHPLSIKIWPRDEAEPAVWDMQGLGGHQVAAGDGMLRLAVSAGGAVAYKSISVDNIHVYGFGEPGSAAMATVLWPNVVDTGSVSDAFSSDQAGHGTPLWWLAQYGLTNAGISFDEAELGDPDNDGFSNWAEYLADTDPTNQDSLFYCDSVSGTVPFQVCFTSSVSRIYTLQCTTNLQNGQWLAVDGGGPRRGSGGLDSLSDTNGASSTSYYRINVELP